MPKTRLTAKLCSTPAQKSPVLEKPNLEQNCHKPAPPPTPVSTVAATPTPAKCSPAPPIHKKGRPEDIARMLDNTSCQDFHLAQDACDSVSDSDSDADDLPDAVFTEAGSTTPAKGDAVWVKYRTSTFWPSLVLQSNPRTRKLHVVFLDNEKHIGDKIYMKYNKKKVLPFNHEDRAKFEMEGKSAGSAKEQKQFQGALSKMADYMTKRALGQTASCKAFLNEGNSSDDEQMNTKADALLEVAPPPPPQCSNSAASLGDGDSKRKRDREEKRSSSSDDAQSSAPADHLGSKRRTAMTPDERRAMRKEKNQPLVDFICSTEMKEHLAKIYRGETPSQRHSLFKLGSSHLSNIRTNSSGPIDDDDQLDTITSVVGNLYQELSHQKLPNMDYIFWVFLPEALIYAIAKVKRCGQKKAADLFEKGIKMTKSEHLEVHNQLIRK